MSSITNVPEGWELRNGKPYKVGEPSPPPTLNELLETSRAFPAEAQCVIADPKATPEQLQKAYSQEIVMVTLSDKECASLNCAKKNQINGQREIHRFYAAKLAEIPVCNATDSASGWNRYDTDNQHVLHIWTDGKSYDIAVPKEDQARELGDREPSSAPPAISDEFVAAVEDEIGMGSGAWDMIHPEEICRAVIKVYRGVRSGTAQEVSPASTKTIASVQEIRPRPDDPSCHVCGAQMVVKEWKCLSCKTTTGVEEVSPPSPEIQKELKCQRQ